MRGMAVYEIGAGDDRRTVRYYIRPADRPEMTPDEHEAVDVICAGFLEKGGDGSIGYSIDPFKAAEEILAEHYGHAEMVEAHYEWRPFIRY